MKSNRKKTKVRFYNELGGVLAVFPTFKNVYNGYRTDLIECYSHVGQHSTCAPEYLKRLAKSKPEQYKALAEELTGLGYDLEILNK